MTAFDLEVLPHVGQVRFLRADLRAGLEECGVAEDAVDQLVLVADEIVNNAIEHGAIHRESADVLRLRVEVDADEVRFEFVDPSAPADLVSQVDAMLRACAEGRPPLDSERGRGLFLIADGLDGVCVDALGERGLRLSGRKFRAPR